MAKQKGRPKSKKVTGVRTNIHGLEVDARILPGVGEGKYWWQAYGWFDTKEEIEEAFEEKHGFKPKRIFRDKLIILAGPVSKVDGTLMQR
jgi:hypothetical protein